jgi:UPF0755 protein
MKRIALIAALAAAALAGGVALSLFVPYRGYPGETFVDIPKGAGTSRIGGILAEAGVVRAGWQMVLVKALRPGTTLKAGEYRFTARASAWTVYGRIARGDVFYYELRVPEGHNLFDIARAVEELGVMTGEDFLAAARHTAMIRDLAPGAPTLEGFLFPSTYRITRHTTAEQLCHMMTEQFRRVWRELGGANAQATVTLASLVEKETAVAAERPVVASVYRNRLQKRIPLQCDPTTIYAALLEHRYQGKIYRTDLESVNSFNTYQHAGLPPGPIANPGRSALEAALQPADTEYLFFVARPDGSGAHRFSTSMAEHEKAVKEYRRGVRKAQKQEAAAQRKH